MEAKSLWEEQIEQLLLEVEQQIVFHENDLFVVGCSTSEIIGEKIGTAGGLEVAEVLFDPFASICKTQQYPSSFSRLRTY